jgi:hypothetical protein
MLKGDLASTPLAPLLVQLAEDLSTGCLHISAVEGDDALVYYKNGLVYAVAVPGHRPQLGAKLVSSGALAPEALADALEAQRTELQGWRLGELLVHLGYVDQPVVEAFVKEQVHDALWDLIKWVDGRWKFRKAEKTREDVAPPMAVADLLADLRERGYEWQTISTVVHGPAAVPVLSVRGGGEPETTLDPDAWSMLCKIDGARTVADLARDCGYTLFEAGQVLVALVNAGLVDIEEDLEVVPEPAADGVAADDERYGANSVSSALTADAADARSAASAEEIVGDDSFADLARLVTEVAASVRDEEAVQPTPVVELPSRVQINAGNDESFAASIARVSEALSDVLGPPPETHDPFEVPSELRIRRKKPIVASEEEARRTRARQAAAAELAAAHALAEALHTAQRDRTPAPAAEPEPEVANVVDLAAVRREAEAERLAAEQEAARVAAEEEAARIAAEQEAARVAEEEAARFEAERVETARIAAEQEAARLAAEEDARLEAERVEAERVEAARIAAEQEAARFAAEEEAARLEAERVEAARVAAEQEAARIAAEQEAARFAAEQEAARLESERAAAQFAAEEEAARLAEEAARVAEAETARLEAEWLATERANAEDGAWAEYWAREARAAELASQRESAASALLTQLASEPVAEVPAGDVDEPPAEVDDEPPPVREPAGVGGRATGSMNDMADTAALLRELSSLGVEDEPAAPSPSRPAPMARPNRPATADKKKKRGLFGF